MCRSMRNLGGQGPTTSHAHSETHAPRERGDGQSRGSIRIEKDGVGLKNCKPLLYIHFNLFEYLHLAALLWLLTDYDRLK
jgi:hypothetical protein